MLVLLCIEILLFQLSYCQNTATLDDDTNVTGSGNDSLIDLLSNFSATDLQSSNDTGVTSAITSKIVVYFKTTQKSIAALLTETQADGKSTSEQDQVTSEKTTLINVTQGTSTSKNYYDEQQEVTVNQTTSSDAVQGMTTTSEMMEADSQIAVSTTEQSTTNNDQYPLQGDQNVQATTSVAEYVATTRYNTFSKSQASTQANSTDGNLSELGQKLQILYNEIRNNTRNKWRFNSFMIWGFPVIIGAVTGMVVSAVCFCCSYAKRPKRTRPIVVNKGS